MNIAKWKLRSRTNNSEKKRSFFEAEQDARKTLLANSTQINEENIKGK